MSVTRYAKALIFTVVDWEKLQDQERKQHMKNANEMRDRRFFLQAMSIVIPSLYYVLNTSFRERRSEKESYQMPIDFRFGDHTLHLDDVESGRYSLVLGETNEWDLKDYNGDFNSGNKPHPEDIRQVVENLLYVVKNGGINSAKRVAENHTHYLQMARSSGIEMAVSGSLSPHSLNQTQLDYFDNLVTNTFRKEQNIVSPVAVALPGAAFIHSILKKDSQRTVLFKGVASLGLEAVALTNRDYLSYFFMNRVERLIQNASLRIRNTTMAYNARLVEELLEFLPSIEEAVMKQDRVNLFYAGGIHRGLKRDYQKGLVFLQSKLISQTEKYVNTFIQLLSPDKNVSFFDEDKILNLFVYLSKAYSFPIGSFYTLPKYRDNAYLSLSDSPRLILWKQCARSFAGVQEQEKIKAGKLFGRLVEEDMHHLIRLKERVSLKKMRCFLGCLLIETWDVFQKNQICKHIFRESGISEANAHSY